MRVNTRQLLSHRGERLPSALGGCELGAQLQRTFERLAGLRLVTELGVRQTKVVESVDVVGPLLAALLEGAYGHRGEILLVVYPAQRVVDDRIIRQLLFSAACQLQGHVQLCS